MCFKSVNYGANVLDFYICALSNQRKLKEELSVIQLYHNLNNFI